MKSSIVTIDGQAVEARELHALCQTAGALYPNSKHLQREWTKKTLALRGVKPRVTIGLRAPVVPIFRSLREAKIHPADVVTLAPLPRVVRRALDIGPEAA